MRVQFNLIQVFRGFAALIVVMHHMSASSLEYLKIPIFNNVFMPGWNGVDFFFVLSGFIITYVHFDDVIKKTNILPFFYKRIVRIYPLYWIIATISLIFFLFSGKYSLHSDLRYIVESYLLIRQPAGPFLLVAWSLSFEVFFYIIFGILIFTGIKFAKIFIPLWFVITLFLNLLNSPLTKYLAFNSFILEFLMGCGVAYIYHKWYNRFLKYRTTLLFAGFVLFAITWMISLLTIYGTKISIESRFLYGTASSAIILGSALIDTIRPPKITEFLLLIGNASYVLYLLHPLVLALIYKSYHNHAFPKNIFAIYILALASLLISIGISILFHLLIEKRVLKFLNYNTLIKKKDLN